ncbi:replication protein RepA [Amycolatopsis methanolica]|uniref:Plasmid encoded RepA protein n=1 Tax=Amycolatopsis methanolica 239 TaxID=1068978 RepID=A0A076MY33_AMYME|nr:replication protein RepA [Amycolatopsis methanolica]AIJ25578.1 plasmid encoded RepA protein [Amycolatopsis methanolica 239]
MTTQADLAFARDAAQVSILDREQQELGFVTRVFASTSLPYKEPPPTTEVWWRRNGKLLLTVTPGKTLDEDGTVQNLGFPFGAIPRLLLAWLSTAAVQTRDPLLQLPDSMGEFMRDLGIGAATGGKKGSISRFRNQTNRLLECNLTVKQEGDPRLDKGGKLNIASSWQLWWSENKTPGPSWIRLSEEFFQLILRAPVPISLHALRVCQKYPVQMDLYWWLTYRLCFLQKPVLVTWEQLSEQFGFQLAPTPRGLFTFKKAIVDNLKKVLAVYQQANVEVTKHGLLLKPSQPHVPFKGLRALEVG